MLTTYGASDSQQNPVSISDSEDPDHRFSINVGNVARKALRLTFANWVQSEHFKIVNDPGDVLIHFIPESETKAPQLPVVEKNGVVRFRSRLGQNSIVIAEESAQRFPS